MNVEAQIADLTRRVTALEKAANGQERHNARVTELLTELKEDVALLRRHAISTGQKVEGMDARLGAVESGWLRLKLALKVSGPMLVASGPISRASVATFPA